MTCVQCVGTVNILVIYLFDFFGLVKVSCLPQSLSRNSVQLNAVFCKHTVPQIGIKKSSYTQFYAHENG